MKRILLSLFIISLFISVGNAQTDSLQISDVKPADQKISTVAEEQQAVDAFNEGKFSEAATVYEKLISEHNAKGEISSDLYYNLGNAYFRDGEIAKAILNYERALLLNPSDKDIRHNIRFANTRIEDKLENTGSFFLSNWINAFQETMSSNAWAWFAVVCFIILIICIFVFFFSKTVLPKKVTFYSGIVLVVLVILGNVFSFRQRSDILVRDNAIIMTSSAVVRSSPNTNGKEVFTLHAGTKVKISKEDRDWSEIVTTAGNVGWVENKRIEKI